MMLPPIDQTVREARERQQAGRFDEAETLYREVLARNPDHCEAWHLLGILAGQVGRPEQAIHLIRRAIEIDPADAEAYGNLGATLRTLGRNEEALAAYREVVRLRPDEAAAHGKLGEICLLMRRYEEAIAAFEEAVRFETPPSETRYYNLGFAQQRLGRFKAASESYLRALDLQPTLAEAYNNLANCRRALGESDSAVEAYRSALQLQPASTEFRSNLSGALLDRGDVDEAVAVLREALELKPGDAGLRSALISHLLFHPETNPASLREEGEIWRLEQEVPCRSRRRPHGNDRSENRCLRIGFVSPDFRRHVIGQNLLPFLREHDRERFSIHCYANVLRPDAVTNEFRALADGWRDITEQTDDAVAEMIRADKIDLLVDVTMHLAGNRLPVFVRKPAPVQVTYLAYCGSTGLESIDYRLSDPYLDPPGPDPIHYREQTVRLPRSYWCYQPLETCPEVAALPAGRTGYVTFGCLNNFAKVSPAALDLWMDILEAAPGSRLLLSAPPGSAREKIRERFARRDLSSDRMEFVGKQPWAEYIETMQRIDVALDPFPYGGGISTCDALWMGVPVVSGLGRMAVGRGGRSILANLGLPELIAETPRQYLDIAVSLARDLARLSALRSGLRQRMEASPLRDAKGFAREVEAAFQFMWSKWRGPGDRIP